MDPKPIVAVEEQTGAGRVRTLIEGLRLSDRADEAEATLYLRVYRELREALIRGAVAPGDLLNIRPIAAALLTSPMPVREALGRLAAEGALEPLANRAFRVPVLGPEKYRELLLIRLRLEGLAGEHAAVRVTNDELGRLRRVHEAIIAEGTRSLRHYLALNRKFHFGVYRAAGLPALLELIELIWLRIGPLLHACHTTSDVDTAIECHGKLLAALERGDGPAAGRAVHQDLLRASKTILDYLASGLATTGQDGAGRNGTRLRGR